ncbi:MAG: hypothetical protein J6P78_00050, partial [Lachnospiraceae bacterium]|nr:hypothetical protein [Lachnospiraceae bacterium]
QIACFAKAYKFLHRIVELIIAFVRAKSHYNYGCQLIIIFFKFMCHNHIIAPSREKVHTTLSIKSAARHRPVS